MPGTFPFYSAKEKGTVMDLKDFIQAAVSQIAVIAVESSDADGSARLRVAGSGADLQAKGEQVTRLQSRCRSPCRRRDRVARWRRRSIRNSCRRSRATTAPGCRRADRPPGRRTLRRSEVEAQNSLMPAVEHHRPSVAKRLRLLGKESS